MTEPTTQPIKIDGYHAHVYYTAETRPRAAQPRETIATALDVEVRELSDAPKGVPHPVPQFRFTFTTSVALKLNTMRGSYRAEQYPTPR